MDLREEDFNQLKNENQQFMEKIEERNQEMERLEMMSGSTLKVLNMCKKKLNAVTTELNRVTDDITAKSELLGQIDNETKLVEQVPFSFSPTAKNDYPLEL